MFGVGFASFFSGCVLPIIPLYMGYLFGDYEKNDKGIKVYHRKTVIIHTFFFILGISTIFYILGLGAMSIGKFLNNYSSAFQKIAGIIIIIFGLFQLNILKLNFLNKNKSFMSKFNLKTMNSFKALLMGILFSFSWTPCIGITLSSVLIMASTTQSMLYGNFLIFIYTLGFILPFIILSLFTTAFFNVFNNKDKYIKIAGKVGGILLLLMGILTFFGYTNTISRIFT